MHRRAEQGKLLRDGRLCLCSRRRSDSYLMRNLETAESWGKTKRAELDHESCAEQVSWLDTYFNQKRLPSIFKKMVVFIKLPVSYPSL